MYKYLIKLAASNTKLAVLLAVSTTLAGCSMEELAGDDQHVPVAHYERYPIEVAKAPIKLEVSSKTGSLQPSQINAIAAFARSAKNATTSKIAIQRPSSGGPSRQVASQTYQLLVQSGISPSMIVQSSYPGAARSPVQISYIRTVAVTKECGDWSSNLADTSSNEPPSNLGCAVQNNIAAMVVNPEDFVVPRASTPALAQTRLKNTSAAATTPTAVATP